jgi:intracellular multiplication protein IcmO
MFIIAGQDVEAMERGENKEEVQSVLANTKTKIALAQEAGSASKTFEVFEKSAGEQFVSQLSGFEARITSVGSLWRNMQTSGIERVPRLDIRELRSLDKGQGVALFMDRLIRFKSFYVFKKAKLQRKTPYRVNRFIQCMNPTLADIRPHCKSFSETLAGADLLLLRLREGAMVPNSSSDRVVSALYHSLKRMGERAEERAKASGREGTMRVMPPAIELGIALYVSALEALESEAIVPEPLNSGQSSVRDRQPLGELVGSYSASNLAAPIAAQEFDPLAYLDNPPIIEKRLTDLLANKVKQDKAEKTTVPVAPDGQRWLEDAIERAYAGDSREGTARAAAGPLVEGAEEPRHGVGFKSEVLETLQKIEVMSGTTAPEDEAVKYEQEVSVAMEWRPYAARTMDVLDASKLSPTEIENLFRDLKESIK